MSKATTEIDDAIKLVESFECSVCGRDKPLAHLQQDHILRLKLNGSIIEFPVCFECWVLAWCGRYEAFEKRHKLGYKTPPRIRDVAPLGAREVGTFTDCKQWEMV